MNIHTIKLKGKEIKYNVRKSKRAKHIGLKISRQKGLEVVLPGWAREKDGLKLLRDKQNWVLEHFVDPELYQERISKQRKYLGRVIPATFEDADYKNWLESEAKRYIPERTEMIADKHGFVFKEISIRRQQTRWGSRSSGGNLSFNYKLMEYDAAVIDYVIVHELCHSKEMNHSEKFWKLVEKLVPNYKVLRKKLKDIN